MTAEQFREQALGWASLMVTTVLAIGLVLVVLATAVTVVWLWRLR